MQPNSQQLARRDLALASRLGIIANNGTNFGSEATFAGEFAADFGGSDYSGEFSADPFGADFTFGVDAVPANAVVKPTPQQAVGAFHALRAKTVNKNKRLSILHPNMGSDVQVERYTMPLSQAIVMGTAIALNLSGNPDVTFRPQILMANSPTPMFATLTIIKVANTSITIGSGSEDAWFYNANAVDRELDMPTLSPANRVTILGNYTGYVPPGFPAALGVLFCCSLRGPAGLNS